MVNATFATFVFEIRVGNVIFFFVLCLVVALVFAIKINRNTY